MQRSAAFLASPPCHRARSKIVSTYHFRVTLAWTAPLPAGVVISRSWSPCPKVCKRADVKVGCESRMWKSNVFARSARAAAQILMSPPSISMQNHPTWIGQTPTTLQQFWQHIRLLIRSFWTVEVGQFSFLCKTKCHRVRVLQYIEYFLSIFGQIILSYISPTFGLKILEKGFFCSSLRAKKLSWGF
jgi:hypothetical protein